MIASDSQSSPRRAGRTQETHRRVPRSPPRAHTLGHRRPAMLLVLAARRHDEGHRRGGRQVRERKRQELVRRCAARFRRVVKQRASRPLSMALIRSKLQLRLCVVCPVPVRATSPAHRDVNSQLWISAAYVRRTESQCDSDCRSNIVSLIILCAFRPATVQYLSW